LSDDGLLGKILSDGRAMERMASDENLMRRLLASAPFRRLSAGHPGLLPSEAQTSADAPGTPGAGAIEALRGNLAPLERAEAQAALFRAWERLRPFIDEPDGAENQRRLGQALALIRSKDEVPNRFLEIVCDGQLIRLAGATLLVHDKRALWIVLNELLALEEYYFEAETDAPVILDCGANFGLAIYYFKRLYPKARVTAFEPVPELFNIIKMNVLSAAWNDVEVLPFALSDDDVDATDFNVSQEHSMAGSLTQRRLAPEFNDHVTAIQVPTRRLSAWLGQTIDFLKLDIEGSEDSVLAESSQLLPNVRHLFVEYHHGAGMPAGRLETILRILEAAGFDCQLGKSFSFEASTGRRAMLHASEPYSLNIWAKNRRPAPPRH
jgi:FkbM family methyltransferase